MKTELVYLHFSVCHVLSRLVTPSFLAKLILIEVATKTDLKTKTFFLREESTVKKQKRQ